MRLFRGWTCITLAVLLATAAASAPAQADDPAYIAVGKAKAKKTVIAFPDVKFIGSDALKLSKTLYDTITSDLLFMNAYTFLPPAAFTENAAAAGITLDQFKLNDWTGIGADYVLKSLASIEGSNLVFIYYLYDITQQKQVAGSRLVAKKTEGAVIAHTAANQIVEALTGLPGIFLTKIAMACEKGGKKEIYTMDFDGKNARQITKHRSIAFAPAWSPDGRKLAYSLYTVHNDRATSTRQKNIDLFELDFASNKLRLLSNRKGINSGAAYSPDGSQVALTMSFQGNPEIFSLDLAQLTVRQLTKTLGFDVDPAWSPDGRELVFASSRTERPMIYRMPVSGGEAARLTFAGRYNATPHWSPLNKKIVFAGWLDNQFDVFIMNPDGTNIERLTKNQGNNEDPYFSPDGSFIAFSSNRAENKNVYVMSLDGSYVKRLTYGLGNCTTPRWSGVVK